MHSLHSLGVFTFFFILIFINIFLGFLYLLLHISVFRSRFKIANNLPSFVSPLLSYYWLFDLIWVIFAQQIISRFNPTKVLRNFSKSSHTLVSAFPWSLILFTRLLTFPTQHCTFIPQQKFGFRMKNVTPKAFVIRHMLRCLEVTRSADSGDYPWYQIDFLSSDIRTRDVGCNVPDGTYIGVVFLLLLMKKYQIIFISVTNFESLTKMLNNRIHGSKARTARLNE